MGSDQVSPGVMNFNQLGGLLKKWPLTKNTVFSSFLHPFITAITHQNYAQLILVCSQEIDILQTYHLVKHGFQVLDQWHRKP